MPTGSPEEAGVHAESAGTRQDASPDPAPAETRQDASPDPAPAEYSIGPPLGCGASAVVYSATRLSDGASLAMKHLVCNGDEISRADMQQEARILASVSHANIIRYYATIETEGNLFIFTERAEGGELAGLIDQGRLQSQYFDEQRIMRYLVQLLLALWHLHSKNVLHRDLKSQNVFYNPDGDTLKIGDLGVARVLDSTAQMAHTQIGTPFYLSPEVVEDRPYNAKSDIWSLGCVLYELCTLKKAFDGHCLPALVVKILRGKYSPVSTRYSTKLRRLVDVMLRQSPLERPDCRQLLLDPFVLEHVRLYAADLVARQDDAAHSVTAQMAELTTPPRVPRPPRRGAPAANRSPPADSVGPAAASPGVAPEGETPSPASAPPASPGEVPGPGLGRVPAREDLRPAPPWQKPGPQRPPRSREDLGSTVAAVHGMKQAVREKIEAEKRLRAERQAERRRRVEQQRIERFIEKEEARTRIEKVAVAHRRGMASVKARIDRAQLTEIGAQFSAPITEIDDPHRRLLRIDVSSDPAEPLGLADAAVEEPKEDDVPDSLPEVTMQGLVGVLTDIEGLLSSGGTEEDSSLASAAQGAVPSAGGAASRLSDANHAVRAEQLRIELEDHIGVERMKEAYDYLMSVSESDSDAGISGRLAEILGPAQQNAAMLIYKLITLEELGFSN